MKRRTINDVINECIENFAGVLTDVVAEYTVLHNMIECDTGYEYGFVDFENKRIVLNSENDYKDNRETLVHEVLHIYFKNTVRRDVSEKTVEKTAQKVISRIYGKMEK